MNKKGKKCTPTNNAAHFGTLECVHFLATCIAQHVVILIRRYVAHIRRGCFVDVGDVVVVVAIVFDVVVAVFAVVFAVVVFVVVVLVVCRLRHIDGHLIDVNDTVGAFMSKYPKNKEKTPALAHITRTDQIDRTDDKNIVWAIKLVISPSHNIVSNSSSGFVVWVLNFYLILGILVILNTGKAEQKRTVSVESWAQTGIEYKMELNWKTWVFLCCRWHEPHKLYMLDDIQREESQANYGVC